MQDELIWAGIFLALMLSGICLAAFSKDAVQWMTSRLSTVIVWCSQALLVFLVRLARRTSRATRLAALRSIARVRAKRATLQRAALDWCKTQMRSALNAVRRARSSRSAQTSVAPVEPTFTSPAFEVPVQGVPGDQVDGAYARALELLNLADVEQLTQPIVKQRYGELMRAVDPGKGYPRTFSIQLNAAVQTIKKVHQWK